MTEKQKLNQKLWDIANNLRGKMGADEFRDYILGFIFYKYLSEKMLRYANKILAPDNMTYHSINLNTKPGQQYLEAVKENAIDDLGYFLEPGELFSTMVMRGNGNGKAKFILDDLQKVLIDIEQSTMGTDSEEDFENLFEDLDLDSSKLGKTPEDRNEIIVKVMEKLDEVDFELDNPENDVLGDAYEYLIGQFASGAGKKAGEFYTPQEVSSVLAKLVTVGKERLKNVYDPTCGSGSLLLRVAREVDEVGEYFGQESNPTTYNLCRMNMIMHDVHYSRFDIKNEDTLERPQHIDKKFEAVVANPPFSAKWSSDPLKMNDDRFSAYGKLAPKSRADFAFVQHMIHQLDDNGTMACVLPHGVLFRSGGEGTIREHIIKELNYLDAVIGLPANIFFGTSIPTCVLVLRKQRTHSEHVLFIDASEHYEKVSTQHKLRPEDISKIIETYKEYVSGNWDSEYTGELEEKYSYITNRDEIAENDYNLNIPRYVDTFEEEEVVDLQAVAQELKALDNNIQKTDEAIANYCKELGIEAPF
ncbi:type I restriction-modification system subunit M [Rhodohalobacter sulfatireducens]|uniref:site-specific DNA-methyltransferase (adenine-specific) n=1 Tax=Rhodohalobacter sulfatireducens TaxID=2911366 RepID=A0ABS9KAC0_9BACT|nr:type I restriction-modification system subunit M [Rhodohalobacter sulfatireducens]MCG2587794.1 type I restriction-modification system subunit M [Rhodohalobacter sulfatireducens]